MQNDLNSKIVEYYKIAKKIASVENLEIYDEDSFSFYNKNDDCKVTISYNDDSKSIIMYQEYDNGNMDDDEVSLLTFENYLSKKKMAIGGFLLGAATGAIATKLLSNDLSKKDKAKIEDIKELTWKEKFMEYVDQEGLDDAVNEYSEYIKDKRFNELKARYLIKSKSLKKYIDSKDIIDSKYDISVQDAVDKEGFDYALVGYHDWKGVKDIKFQTLYENYIKSRKSLSEYVDIFENYEDGGYMANGDYMADGGNLHAKYIAYIEESRRPGGSDRSIKKTYNLDVEDRTSDGFYVIGAKEDIEDFINDYSINFAKIELYKEDGGMMAKGGKTSGLVTITTDAYFGGDGIKDVKEHISNIEKKFKIEIKPTGQLNNDATQEYNITGKKKDILKFLADDSFIYQGSYVLCIIL
jgi:gas vesicle protein